MDLTDDGTTNRKHRREYELELMTTGVVRGILAFAGQARTLPDDVVIQ